MCSIVVMHKYLLSPNGMMLNDMLYIIHSMLLYFFISFFLHMFTMREERHKTFFFCVCSATKFYWHIVKINYNLLLSLSLPSLLLLHNLSYISFLCVIHIIEIFLIFSLFIKYVRNEKLKNIKNCMEIQWVGRKNFFLLWIASSSDIFHLLVMTERKFINLLQT